MSRSFSVYLDLLRFLAAAMVVLGHLVQDGVLSSAFHLEHHGHESVVIFFVLSGVVIATTAARSGETIRTYSIARLSRLYSVVIPALLFSFLVKGLAATYAGGDLYREFWTEDWSVVTVVLPPVFLMLSWDWWTQPPWNYPYWSVCYEAWYYVIFGILFFSKSKQKYWLAAGAALIAGPSIIVLLPIWAAGVHFAFRPAIYSLKRFAFRYNQLLGYVLLCSPFVLIWLYYLTDIDGTLKNMLHDAIPGWWRLAASQRMFTDYLLCIAVLLNFAGFKMVEENCSRLMDWLAPSIRFLSGYTFSVYLFHRPITECLGFFKLNFGSNLLEVCLALFLVLTLCMLLGQYTEKRRDIFRTALNWIFDQVRPLFRTAANRR